MKEGNMTQAFLQTNVRSANTTENVQRSFSLDNRPSPLHADCFQLWSTRGVVLTESRTEV